MGISPIQGPHLPPINPQGFLRYGLEKGPIVGYAQNGARVACHIILQPRNGPQIQMVGGFIQHQQIRCIHQTLRQRRPPQLPPRQGSQQGRGPQIQGLHDHIRQIIPIFIPRQSRTDKRCHRFRWIKGHLLRQIPNPHPWIQRALAAVGFHISHQKTHQGGFSRPIAPHQTDFFSLANIKGGVLKQGLAPHMQADVFKAEQQGHRGLIHALVLFGAGMIADYGVCVGNLKMCLNFAF